MGHLNKAEKLISIVFQIIAALILANAAFGKFSGNEMSVHVFHELNILETRIVIGIIEVLAALLLLSKIPQYGALLGFGTMLGALIAHVSILGMEIHGDGGQMVMMMAVVLLSSIIVMWINRRRMPFVGHTFSGR